MPGRIHQKRYNEPPLHMPCSRVQTLLESFHLTPRTHMATPHARILGMLLHEIRNTDPVGALARFD